MILEVTRRVVNEVADAGTRRLDAAAAERDALGEKLAVVDMSDGRTRRIRVRITFRHHQHHHVHLRQHGTYQRQHDNMTA